MRRILIGMRGGVGDILLFSTVLKEFRLRYPDSEIICGTSRSCEMLVRSLPFFQSIISDFRPRYVRRHSESSFSYRDRRTSFRLDDVDEYYCLDHPYRGASEEESQNIHIIDMAARILKEDSFKREPTVFLPANHGDIADDLVGSEPFIAFAPYCGQKTKMVSFSLFSEFAHSLSDFGLPLRCIVPSRDAPLISAQCERLFVPSILDLASCLTRCIYYVGLDSGVSHLVSAFKKPMTTLHVGYSPKRSGVLNDHAQILPFPSRKILNSEWTSIAQKIREHYIGSISN